MARGPSMRGRQPEADRGKRQPEADRGKRQPAAAPWLDEAAFDDDSPVHTLVGRRALLALLTVAGLLAVGIVVGILLVSRREAVPIDIPAVGEPVPVLADPGPWKVPPEGPDAEGIPVDGQGQTLYGTGDGRPTDARIALDALPEEPLPKPGTTPGGTEVTPLPSPPAATAAAPEKAAPPPPTAPAPGMPKVLEALQEAPAATDGMLQLGAFSSEARARAAFRALGERFSYLAGLSPVILPVASEGRTLYRLRASAGDAAAARDICARLKVAGEACSVVN